ncbi:unnamed protein product [Thlaspi arvense]|uniref:STAS domain-containing protein n=1 Tax=Thlaspi arvense TaxID=13288 RepID=A0AAU9R4N4_THLAR|nr:unnamed protein product [Thlaspi arvense]
MSARAHPVEGDGELSPENISSPRQTNTPFVHKVEVPPKQNLFNEFMYTFKETFFHDDPLRHFKDQSVPMKLMLGLQSVFPVFEWGRNYNLKMFRGDLIAGLTIASLCIPQDIGYAKLANLDPKYGLFSFTISISLPFCIICLQWNWQTILISASFLIFLLVSKFIGKKKKKLFWIPAVAPLLSVVISTFFVYITRADKKGVQIVKHLDKGLNPSSLELIHFSGDYLLKGFRIGVVSGMVALTEAVAIGRTFAAMKDYQIDGNKEMVALGAMNVIGSMTSCYVATGSFSRSAVNFMAGCQTAVSNIIMSIVVLLTLLFLTPLFKYTPNAILAAIIINAVIPLVDVNAAVLIFKIDKLDFVACMGAFFGVIFVSVEIGLLVAVGISFAKILLQVTRPRTAILGKIPRTSVYRNIHQYPEATRVPGVMIIRVDSAIYFSNSNYVRERIQRWLTDEEEKVKDVALPRIQFLIIEMSPVTDIDTSGIHALEDLYKSLQKRDIQLVLANPGPLVIDKLHVSHFADMLGHDKIFLTVAEAVDSCCPKLSDEV